MFPVRENDLSADVLEAGTLSRPLATLVSFLHALSLLDQYANRSESELLALALLLFKYASV